MQKWEYYMMSTPTIYVHSYSDNSIKTSADKIWEKPNPNKKSQYEKIQELGEKGWELMSVTPISGISTHGEASITGYTQEVLFVFKRPVEK
jgi:hypothetical protein